VANIIKPKRSESTGQTPTLSPGELAVNIADKKVWVANSSGTPVLIVDGNASVSETDPVFTASDAFSITTSDITNWNTAYGWGDHASAGYLTTETDPVFGASEAATITATDTGNWNTAYGWGDHSTAGYLTSETDPTFTASAAYSITTSDITNWNTAYGWGDHSSVGYLTIETDPIFTASDAASITATDIGNWNTAYGWGDHALAGYLTIETDPVFSASDAASITATDISTWNAKPDSVAITSSGSTITVTDNTVGGAVSFNLENPQGIATTDSPTFAGLTVASLVYPSADGTSGQVLVTDGAGNLSFATAGGGGASALDDLTDVTIATPAANDVLVYNSTSSQWENTQLTTSPGGNDKEIQFNNSGNLDGASEFKYYVNSVQILTIDQTAYNLIPLTLKSAASPYANLFQWLRSDNLLYGGVSNFGELFLEYGTPLIFKGDSAINGNYIQLQAPANISNVTIFTLPNGDGSSGQVLSTNGSGQLTFTNVIANLSGGSGGSIPYQSNTNTTSLLSPNTTTTKKFLRQTGTGTNGAAPAWDTIAAADVPTLNQNTTGSSGSCTGNSATATTATNLAGGGAGQIPYQSAAGSTAMLSAGTSGQVLRSNGTSALTWESQGLFSGGRLTLTSATPITTSDVTSATTIYYTPFNGDKISLYDGTTWATYTFTQLSLALGTLTSGLNYDVFVYNNAGTLTLETASWTNNTTRETALALTNGIYLKTGALSRRYLGTFRTTSTTTTEDSATKRFVYNANNRISKQMFRSDSTSSWTYATAAWRYANNSSSNRLDFVQGLAEEAVFCHVISSSSHSGSTSTYASIGYDANTSNSGTTINKVSTGSGALVGFYTTIPAVGFHYLAWIEYTSGATATFTGGSESGIYAQIRV
jgi:hypothetical protein